MLNIYATISSAFVILLFGIYGYMIKSKVKTITLNSFTVGMLFYFFIFEIISIPSILLHITFTTFFWIIFIVSGIISIYSIHVYINDYRVHNINHKYRMLIRFWDNKYIYYIITILLLIFIVLFNIFPFTRLRDDDVHWIINIRDNIVHNNLLSTYSENGTYIKFSEMYIFNALTLFLSVLVRLTNINPIAISLVTIRIVWLFILLFIIKDLFYSFSENKSNRNWSFTSFIIFFILWTNTNSFSELPMTIIFPQVGQRLAILLIIPLIQVLNKNTLHGISKGDYILHIMFAFNVMFFATASYFIISAVYLFYLLIMLYFKKTSFIWPTIISLFIMSLITASTMIIYKKVGPGTIILDEFLDNKFHYNYKDLLVPYHDKFSSWITYFSIVPAFKFIVPISFVLWSKKVIREYRLLAYFIIFISIIVNPISFKLFSSIIPANIFERISQYFNFIGYILIYPMIHQLYIKVSTKSDLVKIWQLFIILYISLGFVDINSIVQRNVNIINVQWDAIWSPLDWDSDSEYPIDKYQKQVYDHINENENKTHYVASTSYLLTNYRMRMFDPYAKMITPRDRFHQSYNYKNHFSLCLNTSEYLSEETINTCNTAFEKYPNTYIITSSNKMNNFTRQLSKKFKEFYRNKRFIVYKRNINE